MTSGPVLRAATDADDDAIWAMLEPVFRAGETYCIGRDVSREDALAYWGGRPHTVYMAEAGGATLGTYFLTPNHQGGGAHVCNCGFVTGQGAAGKGVARAMLMHSLATARAQGYLAMQFNFVIATNTRAIAIWESHGFEVVGRLSGAFRSPSKGLVDALVMYQTL